MFKKMTAAATLAILVSSASAATPGSVYAGVDAGSTHFDLFSQRETSIGAFVGYDFSEHFAVELGVRDLGKWDVPGGDASFTQVTLSLIGTLPLGGGFDLYGRAGTNHLSVDNSSREVAFYSDRSTGGNYGVGLAYHFTPTIAGRLEYQKMAENINNISAGIVFHF